MDQIFTDQMFNQHCQGTEKKPKALMAVKKNHLLDYISTDL